MTNALMGICLYLYLVGLGSLLAFAVESGVPITVGMVLRAGLWPIVLPLIAILTIVVGP